MSGHSKWATIKRKKGAADAKRGQMFTKLAREIQLAARGGADPNFNFRLRLAVDKAKAENMPKDNIDRAIKRGAGLDPDAGQLEEVTYEGYGPHGVALYIQVVTDNKNRTVGELRRALTKANGALGESGSVAWLFDQKGLISLEIGPKDQDKVFELALEAGAEDVQFGDGYAEIWTAPSDLQAVRQAVLDAKHKITDADTRMIAKTQVSLSPAESLQVLNLIEHIEELDDVVQVDSNLELSEEALAQLG
ncbi:MAG: YebC/PmpR family DNA-binding transcriptional regulator [Anaerolineae bacterium]|jgi:YebC/PmpR family DNA-binding regulatory protein|nr:YebC/PmpR family DNA-binding transcriptional regulator [Anaerolineae bacterium]